MNNTVTRKIGVNMSAMSRLYTDIQLLLEQGRSAESISQELNVPIDLVIGVEIDMMNYPQDSYDCYDTVNS